MTSPNVDATAESASDKIDGIDGAGNLLANRKVAMLFAARLFGLAKDYAFPEGPNMSASILDQIATLAKLLTRTYKMPDGNTYDLWDMIVTICKYVLTQAPTINATEVDSVNAKAS